MAAFIIRQAPSRHQKKCFEDSNNTVWKWHLKMHWLVGVCEYRPGKFVRFLQELLKLCHFTKRHHCDSLGSPTRKNSNYSEGSWNGKIQMVWGNCLRWVVLKWKFPNGLRGLEMFCFQCCQSSSMFAGSRGRWSQCDHGLYHASTRFEKENGWAEMHLWQRLELVLQLPAGCGWVHAPRSFSNNAGKGGSSSAVPGAKWLNYWTQENVFHTC